MKYRLKIGLLAVAIVGGAQAYATETENQHIRGVPAPGKVTIDGKFEDWDLSGGTFACGDVETQRDQYSVWFHLMQDADNLYVLARWKDETPMNNPGSIIGSHGFVGDCLQFRFIAAPGVAGREHTTHWTCWSDRDKKDIMQIEIGKRFNEGNVGNAVALGAQQAFAPDADPSTSSGQAGKGYVQELSIPWKLLTGDGQPLKAGESFSITLEPNFTVGAEGRMTIKDLFKAGVLADRAFTFMASQCWGSGTIQAAGKLQPQPVRLTDGREFAVTMEKGLPVVNWTGLIKSRELPGFKTIAFEAPADGYVSLNIFHPDGTVARQLLTCAFCTKGRHEVKWDGLTTPFYRTPGEPVPAGKYTWNALHHTGIGLRLRGYACNGGSAPWDNGPASNWGGDHGVPVACAAAATKVYLGWSGAEAGKAMVACNLKGEVQWKNTRGGTGAANLLAADNQLVYVCNGDHLYRLLADTGNYSPWAGTEALDLRLATLFEGAPDSAQGLCTRAGLLYVGFAAANAVAVVDGATGKFLKKLDVPAPGHLALSPDGKTLWVVSDRKTIVAVNLESGKTTPVVPNLPEASGIAIDQEGRLYVGLGAPDHQVRIFTSDGKPVGELGRKGGRPLLGAWVPDGLRFIAGLVVDAEGKLWVTEADQFPKRISVWNTTDGKLVREFFGPTHYGASGGAIFPDDPNIMAGEGCEWKIDPATGRGDCVQVFDRAIYGVARFCRGTNGRNYLAGTTKASEHGIRILERTAEGQYKLRAVVRIDAKEKKTYFWSDRNGDEQEQKDAETIERDGALSLSGYLDFSLGLSSDLTLIANGTAYYDPDTKGDGLLIKVKEFTACGAPVWDLGNMQTLPPTCGGVPSPDTRSILSLNGAANSKAWCTDVASGKRMWWYPSPWAGVHGSHYAPPKEPGLMRGVFGCVGSANLPKPLGTVWAINSNVGEWHLLAGDGYYLTCLFQGDLTRLQWPDKAVPGAILDNCPPGLGGEDFGGSMTQGKDGKLYIQAGKTGLWNVEVVGLESVRAIAGQTFVITDRDVTQAKREREAQLQAAIGIRKLTIGKAAPAFTGNLEADFKGAEVATYQKQESTRIRTFTAWDGTHVYLGWDVRDDTPWVNGADAPEFMYCRGDTVDFQLGTDPAAGKDRPEPVKGDLRLSIGNFKGKPTAVVYRKVADEKNPKVFHSGVIKDYPMDSVIVLDNARIEVKPDPVQKRYTVEAAIPLAALGLGNVKGLNLRGDLGVTHGDPAGGDTILRTYWNNQQTGLVNDEVFELKIEPKSWGEFMFKE